MNPRTRLILKRVATITADVLMINGSFYVALMLHFLWLVRSGAAAASMRSVFTSISPFPETTRDGKINFTVQMALDKDQSPDRLQWGMTALVTFGK